MGRFCAEEHHLPRGRHTYQPNAARHCITIARRLTTGQKIVTSELEQADEMPDVGRPVELSCSAEATLEVRASVHCGVWTFQ